MSAESHSHEERAAIPNTVMTNGKFAKPFDGGAKISRVVFLGVSSAMPVPGKRNTSALALVLSTGGIILCDCGEATQHQMMRSKSLKISRVDAIVVTHMHGDHVFGLFGLLCTMGGQGREEPVVLCGPKGLKRMVETVLELQGGFHAFPLEFNELDTQDSMDLGVVTGGVRLRAVPLKHVPHLCTYGYTFQEQDSPGALDARKAMSLGAKGPMLGRLKRGEDVELADGTVIRSSDCVGEGRAGWKVALLQDCYDSQAAAQDCQDCDLLIHEATYDASEEEKAIAHGHSTAQMAGRFAKQVGAKALVLTHFSPRYPTRDQVNCATRLGDDAERQEGGLYLEDLQVEAAKECGEACRVRIAADFLVVYRGQHGFDTTAANAASDEQWKRPRFDVDDFFNQTIAPPRLPSFESTRVDRSGMACVKHDMKQVIRGEAARDALAMWVADMDLPCCPRIQRAIQARAARNTFGYTFQSDEMWSAVSAWLLKRHRWKVSREQLVFSSNVVIGVAMAVEAFSEPADGVLVMTPLYRPLQELVPGLGRRLVTHALALDEQGLYRFDISALRDSVRSQGVKVMILCSPHNPGGRVWELAELRALSQLCAEEGVTVISDEVHADLVLGKGLRHIPFGTVAGEEGPTVVTFMAPTKTWNLAGLHVSFAVIQDPAAMEKYRSRVEPPTLHYGSIFATEATLAAYTHGEPWLEGLLVHLRGNVDFLSKFFQKHVPEVKVLKPQATFLCWLDCSGLGFKDSDELDAFFLEECGVMLSTGAEFGPDTGQFQRINFACSRKVLERACKAIQGGLEKRRSRGPA